MVQAYNQSAATLNLLRAFAQGGYADLHEVQPLEPRLRGDSSPAPSATRSWPTRLDETLDFMAACGLTSATTPQIRETEFYTSHEALLLHYEQALTRVDIRPRATGTTARPTCCGSATARASPTARMSSSCAACRTRSASSAARRSRAGRPAAPDRRAEPGERARPPDPDRPHGRRQGRRRSCRRWCARREAPGRARWCGRATRCTATPSRRPTATRPGLRPHPERGEGASSPCIAPRAPMPAACISR